MIRKASVYGNPFVGLFIKANEEICLVGESISEKVIRMIEDFAKPIKISIADSDLIGLFSAMNSYGLILDRLTNENEIEEIKKRIKEEGVDLNIYKMKTKFSPGNNICTNDFGCIINEKIEKEEIKEIKESLNVEVFPMKINSISTVGSAIFATNKFFIAYPKICEEKFNEVKEILKVNGYPGTLNSGYPFPSIAIAGNSKGCIVGNTTTGFEIYRLNEYW